MGSATALIPTRLLIVQKKTMVRMLHEQPDLADRFITYILSRNIRIEEDLIDQLFNSSEKRLARALLLLARYGIAGPPRRLRVKVSQEVLAEMVGTTRPRVNYFMQAVPIGKSTVIGIAVPTLVPILVLLSTQVPIKDVLKKIIGALL